MKMGSGVYDNLLARQKAREERSGMTHEELLERGLEWVAEFNGDARCSINCLYSETLAAEIIRQRTAYAWLETQWSLLLDHVTNGLLSKPYEFRDIQSVVDDAITKTADEAVAEETAGLRGELAEARRELALTQLKHKSEWQEGRDLPRLVAQAHAIGATLLEAGIGPCSLPEGVTELVRRLDDARRAATQLQAQLAEAHEANARLAEERNGAQENALAYKQALAAIQARRCGNCSDWDTGPFVTLHGLRVDLKGKGLCKSEHSACASPSQCWPASHGCSAWRAKEGV
jgi:hypothetical protein